MTVGWAYRMHEGLHEIFKYAHLKFTVYGRKHTYIHNFRQCSHSSVGLTQARPNKLMSGVMSKFAIKGVVPLIFF